MDIREINKVLREKAIQAGLCNDWQERVWNRDLTMTELLTIYKRGIDFSLKQEWFDYDFIKREFPIEELHEANIYIDEEVNIKEAESGTWVFLGKCHGSICFDDFTVGNIYLRHDTRMKVISKYMAKVFVAQYDNAEAEVHSRDGGIIKQYDRRNK